MFEFTIKENELLNDFMDAFSRYVNKSYKFTMTVIATPQLKDYRDNERLILIAINKAIYQNLYCFFRLNESNMQYAAFSCLESAVYAMRLYYVLSLNPVYMHDYITKSDFSLEDCEIKLAENEKEKAGKEEEFSIKEFYNGLHQLNTFALKNSSISTQLVDNNIYLGLTCGNRLSDELQNEVRKNLIGAYLSLYKHTRLFFNGGLDKELEELEADLYAKFAEYVKRY